MNFPFVHELNTEILSTELTTLQHVDPVDMVLTLVPRN